MTMCTKPLKISIGIFAYNEEKNILRTLESLANQDIFKQAKSDTLVVVTVVANGCNDNTVALSNRYFNQNGNLDGVIMEIPTAGKSNAWNEYIHANAQSEADYFVCMDSDISFGSADVISTLLKNLIQESEAYLSVDIAKKDTSLKKNKSLFEHASLFFSGIMQRGSTAVAGSLYCARGGRLRRIFMPVGLPVEDGFLRAMLVTDLFTCKDNNIRILVVDDVCHYFTPDSSIKALLKHEERLLIGTFINSVIYGYLWAEVANSVTDAGQLVETNNLLNPNWVEDLITKYRESHRPLIPRKFYYKYWNKWARLSRGTKILTFPMITLASIIKYLMLKKIQRKMSKESCIGYW